MSKKDVVEDFLEVDDPIGGQNYVCMSFIDPEEIIQNKEAFKVSKFLQSYAKDNELKFNKVYEDYMNFQYKFQDEIQRDFDANNKNVNNIRGVKIRGVYSTKEEAEARSKKLHRTDSTFHVFVGQVGYWLPFNPCADKIANEEYIDSGLNNLMKQYKENSVNKDILYEEQKRDKISKAIEENKKAELEAEPEVEPEPEPEPDAEPEPESEVDPEPESEVEPKSIEEDDKQLDESLKTSLDDVDPWLQNKLEKESP